MKPCVLLKGRPDAPDGRPEKEIRVYNLLDRLQMTYWRIDHPDMAAESMDDFGEIDKVLEAKVCKNLFLCNRQRTKFYLLMMPGDKVFKTRELSHQINSARLSFASGEDMEAMLDCAPGSASVLGLMNDPENRVQLLIDRDVLASEFIGCHPCINTSSLKLLSRELLDIFLPAVQHEAIAVSLVGEA